MTEDDDLLTDEQLDEIVLHCSVQNFRPVRSLIYRAVRELREARQDLERYGYS